MLLPSLRQLWISPVTMRSTDLSERRFRPRNLIQFNFWDFRLNLFRFTQGVPFRPDRSQIVPRNVLANIFLRTSFFPRATYSRYHLFIRIHYVAFHTWIHATKVVRYFETTRKERPCFRSGSQGQMLDCTTTQCPSDLRN